ncbi:hypothetical protein F9U64_11990 [Gracilibacillus oryzae]|uniref:Group-specific protein n=1 Tax=Gracilibacillus oryzae TaxID=1672701 RepID=A0A7C8GT16_9BACI|nr:hypothetical protein [Gracilibacillus oryzae]KAB8133620.1 hypothetical protein F9U64_11990 [Gracilibacillus oryzae]
MENSFEMETDTSFTLNFLIYIQNMYLNQIRKKDEPRFPYLSTKVVFKEGFEIKYRELWNEVSQKIFSSNNDMKIFYEDKDLFYLKLFENSPDNLKSFNEVYKAFRVWWGSFAGRFSMERSIDETGHTLYVDLSNWLMQRGETPQKRLHISLIYDECVLADTPVSSYLAVIPIRDFFINYKELVPRIRECFY